VTASTLHYQTHRNLTQKITSGTKVHEYVYDYQGRRITKKYVDNDPIAPSKAINVRYVYGAYGELLAQYSGLSLSYWNISAGGETIGRAQPNDNRYYYLKDHLGSVRVTVAEDGTIVGWDDYFPFGLQNLSRFIGMTGRSYKYGNDHDDQKFTGHFLEQEGGLGIYHAVARMYDPETGRFYGVDAMRSAMPGWNTYHYTFNNPVRYVDPDGNRPNSYNNIPARYNPLSQLQGMWNTAVSYISNAPANAAQEMKSTSIDIVQNGSEALDYLTVSSTGVAVAAAGIAVGTGPEPVSTGSAGAVAGIAATTAAASDAIATGLSLIDAFVLDGDKGEALTRLAGTLTGYGAGRATAGIARKALTNHNPKNLTTSKNEALSKGAGAVTSGVVGTGAQNAATPTPSNESPEQKRTPEER
jgi:RHS repeat-associated protein